MINFKLIVSKNEINKKKKISEQESSNSTGQKFANFKQPSTSSTGSYDIPMRKLEEALYKERISHLHRYCLSQKLLQEKIHKKAEDKERLISADKYPRQR